MKSKRNCHYGSAWNYVLQKTKRVILNWFVNVVTFSNRTKWCLEGPTFKHQHSFNRHLAYTVANRILKALSLCCWCFCDFDAFVYSYLIDYVIASHGNNPHTKDLYHRAMIHTYTHTRACFTIYLFGHLADIKFLSHITISSAHFSCFSSC